MKLRLRSAVVGVTALTIAGGGLAGMATSAFAAGPPPWEPDPNTLGSVLFYDAAGNQLTGGTNVSHIADYLAASTAVPAGAAGATKANLVFANPTPATPTGSWPAGAGSSNTNFPNTTAPAPIAGPGFTNPVVTLGALDGNLGTFVSGHVVNTVAGYVDQYQVRVFATGPGGITTSPQYWETDIQLTRVGGSPTGAINGWQVVSPNIVTTTLSLTATPPSPQTFPSTPVTLHSTVTPSENGTITFFDGATQVGTPQAVTTSAPTATVTTAAGPALGTHPYKAVFSPTDPTLVAGSTASLSYVVGNPAVPTSTALSVNPNPGTQGAAETFTANVTAPTDPSPPAGQNGSVQFFAGASSLGVVATNDGTVGEYKLSIASLALTAGTYQITAVFTPASTVYAPSTSPQAPLVVGGTPVCALPGSNCSDTQPIQVAVGAGSITITTPYTAAHPFVLPALALASAGGFLTTSAQFPAASDPQITVTSTLATNPDWTVSVSGTDLTDATSDVINGQNVGLTAGAVVTSPGFAGTVAFTDNPALSPPVAAAAPGALGIKGGPHQFAQTSGGGDGTVTMKGLLTINAPSSTPAGTYNGTITFSVV